MNKVQLKQKKTNPLLKVAMAAQIAGSVILGALFLVYLMSPSSSQVDKVVFPRFVTHADEVECGADGDGCLTHIFPVHTSVSINNGEECSESNTVSLHLSAKQTSEYIISDKASFADASWQSFSDPTTLSWTFEDGDGEKTIYVIYKTVTEDKSFIITDTVLVDSLTKCGTIEPPEPVPEDTENIGAADQQDSAEEAKNNTESVEFPYYHSDQLVVDLKSLKYGPDESNSEQVPVTITEEAEVVEHVEEPVIEESSVGKNQIECPIEAKITGYYQVGSSGSEVVVLQDLLKCLGFFPENIRSSGYFGSITRLAVIKFQAESNIAPVGIVGPKTRVEINKHFVEKGD